MAVNVDPEGRIAEIIIHTCTLQDKRVLEVGCGDGKLTWQYAGVTTHVTGLDPDPDDIAAALQNTPDYFKEKVQFIPASIDDYTHPSGDPKFDIALYGRSL